MYSKVIILLLALFLLSFKPVNREVMFDFKIDYFDIDVLGNIYVVAGSELSKYNSDLDKQATFANLSLGEISSIDASDAMNLLVFYEDFTKVLFLDNTLSIKNSIIDLAEFGFPNANLACLSYNNAFWIFDPVNQELIRITQFMEIGERSGNLNQIIDLEIEPDQLFESGNHVYLKDSKEGVFIFDRYAGFIKRMPFIGVEDVQISGENTLNYLRDDTLFSYNMQTLSSDTTTFSVKSIQKFVSINMQHIFLDKKGSMVRDYLIGTPSF